MAEGLFRHATKGRGDYEVFSAGVGAIDGLPPSEYAVRALRELGIDISHQRSRMLSGEVVRLSLQIFPCYQKQFLVFLLIALLFQQLLLIEIFLLKHPF